MDALCERARGDRRASSVPLLTFGAVFLLSAPFQYVPFGPLWRQGYLYWWVAGALGFAVVALWYRRRRIRFGVGSGRGAYGAGALAVALLLILALPASLIGGPPVLIALVLAALAVPQRNTYLAVCATALGIAAAMESSYLLSGKLNTIAEQIIGPPSHGGQIYEVQPLIYALMGLAVLTAGLVSLRNERAGR
ncbi:hypothetical protein [Streptomyces sp. NPDC002851]